MEPTLSTYRMDTTTREAPVFRSGIRDLNFSFAVAISTILLVASRSALLHAPTKHFRAWLWSTRYNCIFLRLCVSFYIIFINYLTHMLTYVNHHHVINLNKCLQAIQLQINVVDIIWIYLPYYLYHIDVSGQPRIS